MIFGDGMGYNIDCKIRQIHTIVDSLIDVSKTPMTIILLSIYFMGEEGDSFALETSCVFKSS